MGSKQITYIHLNEFTPECHAFHDAVPGSRSVGLSEKLADEWPADEGYKSLERAKCHQSAFVLKWYYD